MPRTGYKCNEKLSIKPDEWRPLAPGSVITGTVCNDKLVKGVASVKIRLVGRAKAKIAIKWKHGSSFYRNSFPFFDASACSWILFEDEDGVQQASSDDFIAQSWPFRVQIPTTVSPSAIASDIKPEMSFLPLDSYAVSQTALPDVFHYTSTNAWTNTTLTCFVEYYLEAQLCTSNNKTWTSTLPLLIYSPKSQGPLRDGDFMFQLQLDPIALPLLPSTSVSLGAPQPRAKSAFWSRSKAATPTYTLEISCPTRLQLGCRIPLLLRALPIAELARESATLPAAPLLRLDSIKLTIKSTTEGIRSGTFSPKIEEMSQKYTVHAKEFLPPGREPLHVPAALDVTPLDLGDALDLVLYEDGVAVAGKKITKAFKPKLAPDLRTFCIRHTHQLIWELRVTIVGTGKIHRAKITTDVQIEGPSKQTVEQAIAELTHEERKARFKAVMTGTNLSLEGLIVVSEILQAFTS